MKFLLKAFFLLASAAAFPARSLVQADSSIPIFGAIGGSFSSLSFSEENGGHSEYRDGSPVAGIMCTGDYCDNKQLKFYQQGPTPADRLATKRGPWITDNPGSAHGSVDPGYENQVSGYDCKDVIANSYITRFQCQDDNCDNIRFTCESARGVSVHSNSVQTAVISDENSGSFTCGNGYVLTGVGCSGDKCDNLHLTCSKYVVTVSITKIESAYRRVGIGSVTVTAERSLSSSLSQARSSSSDSSYEISTTVELGFAGEIFSGGASTTATVAQSFSSSVTSQVDKTDEQFNSQSISIDSAQQCNSPLGVVYQYGHTIQDSISGSSSIQLPEFVCSLQHLPPPKCLPQDCGNVLSTEAFGIAPGCQCCKHGSPSATLPGRVACGQAGSAPTPAPTPAPPKFCVWGFCISF